MRIAAQEEAEAGAPPAKRGSPQAGPLLQASRDGAHPSLAPKRRAPRPATRTRRRPALRTCGGRLAPLHARTVPTAVRRPSAGCGTPDARPLSRPRVRHLQPAPAAPLPPAAGSSGNSRRPSSAANSERSPRAGRGSAPAAARSRELC